MPSGSPVEPPAAEEVSKAAEATQVTTEERGLWIPGLQTGVAALVLIVSTSYLLINGFLSDTNRVLSPFTRVGGPTRIETALEASHFWGSLAARRPYVVTVPTSSDRDMQLCGAGSAIGRRGQHPVPLLFGPPATPDRTVRFQDRVATLGAEVREETRPRCPAQVDGSVGSSGRWNILESGITDRYAGWPVSDELMGTVILASEKSPTDTPDVAVAFVLAAHLAAHDHEVTVIVVPRYLEANLEFEQEMRRRSELVTGGVVIGNEGRVPKATADKLRGVLAAPGLPAWLAGIKTWLGDLDLLLAAVLALVAGGAAVQKGSESLDVVRGRRGFDSRNERREDVGVKRWQWKRSATQERTDVKPEVHTAGPADGAAPGNSDERVTDPSNELYNPTGRRVTVSCQPHGPTSGRVVELCRTMGGIEFLVLTENDSLVWLPWHRIHEIREDTSTQASDSK